MTRPFHKSLIALAAAALGVVAFAGCGNDVPAGAVAKVGDSTITQEEFDHWMTIAVRASPSSRAAPPPCPSRPTSRSASRPRRRRRCRRASRSPRTTALKKQCKSEFDTLKREVMQFLIQGEWVQQEAEKRGIKVKDAELQKALEDQKKQVFPNDKQYQQFLKTSGMTEEDLLFRVKLERAPAAAHAEGHRGREEGLRRGHLDYYEKNKKRSRSPSAATCASC